MTSSGDRDLTRLLQQLCPEVQPEKYVFCTFPNAKYGDHPEYHPVAVYQEKEGLTMVIPEQIAKQEALPYDLALKAITMKVHSSLEAVGMTAAIAAKLTEKQISANVIAAYFHDHIFVPTDRVEEAMVALKELSNEARQNMAT